MRYILCLLLSLALAGESFAFKVLRGSGNVNTTCDPIISNTAAVGNHYSSNNAYYLGNTFTISSAKTICSVVMLLAPGGGDISTKTYTVNIWSLDGNNLDVSQGSGTLAGSEITTLDEYTIIMDADIYLSSGTYAVTITDGLGNDNTNKILIKYSATDSADTGVGALGTWDANKYYSNPYNSVDFMFSINARQ